MDGTHLAGVEGTSMKFAFALLLAVHGAIHLMGFAKAFGFAEMQQLHGSIGRPMGVLWLAAALACFATALLLFVSPDRWWVAAGVAVTLSQAMIVTAWPDAKFGTAANLVVLIPVVLSLLDLRPSSLRSIYRSKAEHVLTRDRTVSVVTDADLARLPSPVQTYLRRVGVVGRPRVRNLRAEFLGQMRSGASAGWMTVRAEQVEDFDEPARLFYMTASRSGIPFAGLHVYEGASASMQVRVASLFDVVNARGPEMNRSETVTLFNDMCLLAPATLLGANVAWRPIDDRHVGATFRNRDISVSAELVFGASGDLVNFISTDRDQSADGKTFRRFPWSTPVREYGNVGGQRLPAVADATWTEPSGEWVYARFEVVAIDYNITADAAASSARSDAISAD